MLTKIKEASQETKVEASQKLWLQGEARPNQEIPEGDWQTWLLLAGRGFGKTRTGAEAVRILIERGEAQKAMLVSKNPQDAREDMIEDMDSGLLACCSRHYMPNYEPGNKRIMWPDGQVAHIRTGAKPDNIRGGGYDLVWMDELAAWDYPQETYNQIQFVCRRGNPREVITTTPKPIPVVQDLFDKSKERDSIVLTTGSTYDNRANLSEKFFNTVVSDYEGTRLGQQELHAEILSNVPGALWSHDLIQTDDSLKGKNNREIAEHMDRIVVTIDPAVTNKDDSDETGIVVCGKKGREAYILDDLSLKESPQNWASTAVRAYHSWNGDRIVAETNQGGDMVENTIRQVDEMVSFKQVKATKGKRIRAEPIAALYEQGRVYHREPFNELENQLCTWEPGDDSPDRLDALVWGLTELMLENRNATTW